MARDSQIVDPKIVDYLRSVTVRQNDLLRRLREETASHPRAMMQISPEQGPFLAMLVKLTNAKKAIEVGVFTGYSSICTAQALPEDGKLIALDISEEFTNVARRYWKEANLENKIDLRLGPAVESLDKMIANGEEGTYDFAFIDADKPNYANYYERCLKLLRKGGLIAIDNVLWHGSVADETQTDENTVALRELNKKIYADDRVDVSMVPLADGITLCLKK